MAEIFTTSAGFVAASSKIKEYVINPIKNQFRYLFCYDNFTQSLRLEVERLDNRRASLQLGIDAARRNVEVIVPDVEDWLRRVDEMKITTDRIFGAVPEVENGACLNGTCSCTNLKFRYSLSREAIKLTADVVELIQEDFGKLGKISYPVPPMEIETIPDALGTLEFESRKHIEEEIMTSLRGETIFMIGICGMGGVGKTTMARKIGKMASEEKIFDAIVMVVVSQQHADPKKIQLQIAEGLGLDLKQETVSIRAGLLYTRLMGTKKVLIVLDDIWGRLNLEEIGIPSGNIHKGCKIILTSRIHHVCTEMDATKILSLGTLPQKEAWDLFTNKAGGTYAVDEPDLPQIAKDVAKECKGLPLALVTVASALRNTSKHFWEDAFLQLQCSAPTNIPGVLKDVYQPLQLSYNALESDEARYLFLICCLFPEDCRISLEDLVHYGIGLGIFSNIGNLKQARKRVYGLVEMLKNRFLLMDAADCYRPTEVKMHDVIRDMAIWISSKGKQMFRVSHDMGLTEWLKEDSCQDYTCISLTLGKAMAIPESINYPKLEALLMKFEGRSATPKLPNSFFNGMRGLRLLSIYRVFPSTSLHLLAQLRALHLHDCDLEMISLIGELVNLEILSLRGSNIKELPNEIGALTKLKLLDLTDCCNLENIRPGVVSRLVRLEDLRLFACPIKWESEEKVSERSNSSLSEVFSLRSLSTLEIWIQDLEVIPQDKGHWQKLTSYIIRLGGKGSLSKALFFSTVGSYIDSKRMIVNADQENACANSMPAVFTGAEELDLRGNGSKDIIDLLARQGFENVKELTVLNIRTTKHLANTIQPGITPSYSGIFPVLRQLDLEMMNDLEEICHGPPTIGSFSKLEYLYLYDLPKLKYLWKNPNEKLCLFNLKEITISDCQNLQWVFLLSTAESLCKLEGIEIEDCPNMEEVFKNEKGSEDGDSDATFNHIKFPKLNKMILRRLPKLYALCKAVDAFDFPSIKSLEINEVSPSFKFF